MVVSDLKRTGYKFRFYEYFIVMSTIINTRTIYSHSELNDDYIVSLISLILLFVGVLFSILQKRIVFDKDKIKVFLVLPIYILIYLIIRPTSLVENCFYFLNAYLIFIYAICQKEGSYRLLVLYRNVITVVAFFSIIFWLFFTKLEIIKTYDLIWLNWSKSYVKNYYYIYFNTQYMRNTSIFTEAPMASLNFSVALIISLFLMRQSKTITIRNVILSIAILSTTSATGYILLVLAYGLKLFIYKPNKHALCILKNVFFLIALIFGFAVVIYVLKDKLSSPSGVYRFNDILQGLQIWKENIVFGLGSGELIDKLNPGTSNSPIRLLAENGIYIFWLYFICFEKYILFNKKNKSKLAFIILFLYLFTISSMQFTGLMMLLLAYFWTDCIKEREVTKNVESITNNCYSNI